MRKRLFIVLVILALLLPQAAPVWAAPTPSPRDFDTLAPNGELKSDSVDTLGATLVDSKTGKVLFAKDADVKVYPASTTKIMTCLLALEHSNLSDKVTVGDIGTLPPDATTMGSPGVIKGEIFTMEDLLYGLMLPSGNDAAVVIAQYIGGSVQGFADMMNAKAQELGMTNTHFVNPNGLHDDNHYTTASDMSKLAVEAMKYPAFRKIVSTEKYVVAPTNKCSTQRTLKNTNRLISSSDSETYAYDPAIGIKTGYTDPAKSCLVSAAAENGMELVSVVLGDATTTGKWTDSITMFEYGFQFYDTVDVQQLLADKEITYDVPDAAEDDPSGGQLALVKVPQNQAFITDKKDKIQALKNGTGVLEEEVVFNQGLTAPIKLDQEIGYVAYKYDGQEVLRYSLLASRDVNKRVTPGVSATLSPNASVSPGTQQQARPFNFKPLIWIFALILAGIVALILVVYIGQKRRYQQYSYSERKNRSQGRSRSSRRR